MNGTTMLTWPGPRPHFAPLPDVEPVVMRPARRRSIRTTALVALGIRAAACLALGIVAGIALPAAIGLLGGP